MYTKTNDSAAKRRTFQYFHKQQQQSGHQERQYQPGQKQGLFLRCYGQRTLKYKNLTQLRKTCCVCVRLAKRASKEIGRKRKANKRQGLSSFAKLNRKKRQKYIIIKCEPTGTYLFEKKDYYTWSIHPISNDSSNINQSSKCEFL